MKRFLLTTGLVAAVVGTALAPATADEFSDLLEEAAEADYAGRQIVVTFFDGETALEIVEVEHAGSLMIVNTAGNQSLLGAGKLSETEGGMSVSSWNSAQMSDRYSVGTSQAVRRLDRDATSIDIVENGRVRMRIVFDDATSTPMVREVYDGSGKLFRLTSMLEIDPIPAKLYSSAGHHSDEYDVLVPTSRHTLPAVAAGYSLADAYAGSADDIQGFYSDGLFSFSLFEIEGHAVFDRFEDATAFERDGRRYDRLVNPGEMWITWRANGNTFVLVGDLPPDHLEAVLGELPQPGARTIFSRLWRGIFG